MIRKVDISELNICAEVIKESFLPVANEFNITKENSPNYVAFTVNTEKLKKQYDNGRIMYVYQVENKIVGFFSLCYYDNECELNNLCVLPEYQHKGYGGELLNFAISLAKQNGAKKIKLSIVEENSALKKWYSQFGFIHTHTVKYDFFSFTCGYMEIKL